MCKVSVVVPVYNVEEYLGECIESLINQSFEDIEIILVDDGSKDLSGAICDEYAIKDNRIKVFHKENEGASVARKFGVENSSGEYISFVDSDDYVERDFINELYKGITKNDADLAECDYTVFSEKFSNRKKLYSESVVRNKKDFLDIIVKGTIINGEVAVVMWNKLYKKKIINELVSDYGESLLEDYIFNIQYYAGVNKYVYIDKSLINYRQLQNSLSRKYNPNTYLILKQVQKLKLNFMENIGLNDNECMELSNRWYIKYVHNYLKNMFAMNNGLSASEKRLVAMEIFKDSQLKEICGNMKEKNEFITNILDGNFSKNIKELRNFGYKIKLKHILSKIKFVFVRSKRLY